MRRGRIYRPYEPRSSLFPSSLASTCKIYPDEHGTTAWLCPRGIPNYDIGRALFSGAMNVRTRQEIARRQPDCFISQRLPRAVLFSKEEKKTKESIFTPRCNLSGITLDEFPSVRKRETRSLKVTSVLSFKSPDPPIYSIPLVREHSIYISVGTVRSPDTFWHDVSDARKTNEYRITR